jgi:hypothetical protein
VYVSSRPGSFAPRFQDLCAFAIESKLRACSQADLGAICLLISQCGLVCCG